MSSFALENENWKLSHMVQGLTTEYGNVYGLNLSTNEVTIYRYSGTALGMDEQLRLKPEYSKAMKLYIETNVWTEDHEMMYRMTELPRVIDELRKKETYIVHYRVMRYGELHYYYMKATRIGEAEDFDYLIVAFANEDTEIKRQEALLDETINAEREQQKILIVEEDGKNRALLKSFLEKRYSILEAENGEEGLEIFRKNAENLLVVLWDMNAKAISAYEFLKRIREDASYAEIPVVVMTGYASEQEEAQCLDMGAHDFIKRPYHQDIILRRISSIVRLKESAATLKAIEFDELTGLHTVKSFFHHAENMMKYHPDEEYDVILSDIVNFKRINERYGREIGDEILKIIALNISLQNDMQILSGRYESDQFVTFFKHRDHIDFDKIIEQIDAVLPIKNMLVKFGVYEKVEHDIPMHIICDRIKIALKTIKNRYDKVFVKYDDDLKKKVEQQNLIEDNMRDALELHQFQVYYQPKHDLAEDRSAGAEALVRWIHPEFGFMNPGMFIPMFEKNGFIRDLDWYIWEEVCRNLAEWKNNRQRIVPISVNVSRRDFEQPDFAEKMIEMLNHYGIEHSLFHIEVTESSYSYNPELISENIKKLHEAGLVIELDDFGTGYSSLTALCSMPLDILKLDMSLLKADNLQTDRNVLEYAVDLAKVMKLRIVQEGVETREQVERMKALGCDYVQGYYYSRPLNKSAFEEYLEHEVKQG